MEYKDPVAEKLGIAPMTSTNTDVVVAATTALIPINPREQLLEDYQLSRKNLHELMKQGMEAVNLMMAMTDSSQHPRSAEVLAVMLKNVADINDKLMILQEKIAKLESQGDGSAARPTSVSIGNIDKAVFTGTTNDLLASIKKNQE